MKLKKLKVKVEPNLNKKILTVAFISFVLLLTSYGYLFKVASEINNEISFRNYLSEKGYRQITINANSTPIINNTDAVPLKFPLQLQIIMGILLGVIFELLYLCLSYYRKLSKKLTQPLQPTNP